MIEPQISFHPDHYFQRSKPLSYASGNAIDMTDNTLIRDDHMPPQNTATPQAPTPSSMDE